MRDFEIAYGYELAKERAKNLDMYIDIEQLYVSFVVKSKKNNTEWFFDTLREVDAFFDGVRSEEKYKND